MAEPLLEVEDLTFGYRQGIGPVLRGVNLVIRRGEFVAIQGRSGSGKSTLFHVLGCLLKPDSGRVRFNGLDLTTLSSDELAYLRNRRIGFVFQQFYLLPRATVLQNISLPSLYPCEVKREGRSLERAKELANAVGLGEKLDRMPNQLSGGEQQRVVIARALMSDAELILADEPTGNLDSANALNIIELLKELNRQGKTIVLITHDSEVARHCSRVIHVQDGKLLGQEEAPALVASPQNKPLAAPLKPGLRKYARLALSVAPLAFENLKRNKVRAFLTMIGVTVGIASVFAMVTFGQFAKNKILQGYQELGVNTILMRGHENYERKATDRVRVLFRSFSWEKDVLPLKRIFPSLLKLSPLHDAWSNSANFGGQVIENEVMVVGVSSDYLSIMNRELSAGRGLTPYHVDNRSSVCVVGAEIGTRLFKDTSPVGKILFVTRNDVAYPCQIIGVMKPQSSNKDWRKPNLDVLIPFTYFKTVNTFWENEMHEFVAQLAPNEDTERVSRGIQNFFEQKYGTAGSFRVDSDTLLLSQMKKFLGLFAVMLTAIALITLAVGGMGINNMMLVAISERLKEIGLRKAVGATDRSVRVQFLLESTFLSGMAGIAGVLLGFSGYELIIYFASKFVTKLSFEWVLEPSALALSLISIVVVGIASGIVPALKAERLNVIEALRTE